MPAQHSTFLASANDPDTRIVGNFAVLPLRTKIRGPAYPPPSDDNYDILDEVLDLFRVNTFFRNFEVKGPADRALIYGILFVSDCLSRLHANTSVQDATRSLNTLAIEQFSLPGDEDFPLKSIYTKPQNANDRELLRTYLTQFRQELAQRLIEKIYDNPMAPNKYWLAFTKRKFMNISLS